MNNFNGSGETIRALRAELDLGYTKLDCYQLPNGEYRIGSGGVSKAFGYTERWFYSRIIRPSNWLETLRTKGFSGEIIEVSVAERSRGTRGASRVKTLSEKDFRVLCMHEASHGNDRALEILHGQKFNTTKNIKKCIEKKIQSKLAKQEGGTVEVPTPVGRIDVLTSTQIIEVKEWRRWKEALGQILSYAEYYPDRERRVHLFGCPTDVEVFQIETIFKKYEILTTWEEKD